MPVAANNNMVPNKAASRMAPGPARFPASKACGRIAGHGDERIGGGGIEDPARWDNAPYR